LLPAITTTAESAGDERRQTSHCHAAAGAAAAKDASLSYDLHPTRLFVCMTITRIEHSHALYDTLEHFSRLLDDDR
jgi:hypothetical protein